MIEVHEGYCSLLICIARCVMGYDDGCCREGGREGGREEGRGREEKEKETRVQNRGRATEGNNIETMLIIRRKASQTG